MRRSLPAQLLGLAAIGVSLLLAACGTPPVAGTSGSTPAVAAEPGAVRDFEARQRERAQSFGREGRLAEAVDAWAVLALLKPAQYADELAAAQKRADLAAAEHLARAKREAARGNTGGAEQFYLAALAMKPDLSEAADALRSIERARNKRDHLSKPPRLAQGRPEPTAGRATVYPAAANANNNTNNNAANSAGLLELEQASTLAAQGELGEAIDTLERRLKKGPQDEAARKLLADLYFRQARKLQATNVPAARSAVERSVKLDPKHAEAQALLKQFNSKALK